MRASGSRVAVPISIIAVLLIMLVAMPRLTANKAYGIATPPMAPEWLSSGEYIEYNQTYSIEGLTASINVKDTVLANNGAADLHIERFGPHIPKGFPEPGVVAPYDSANESQATIVVTTFVNGTTRTTTEPGGSAFTTDLTMFADDHELAYTNKTLDSVSVPYMGSTAVQAWKVNESALYLYVGGAPVSPSAPVIPSFVWFEKSTLMKIRESTNFTDPLNNYVVSIETIEDTNIPQLKSALMYQGSNSTQATGLPMSSSTSTTAQSPDNTFEEAALLAAFVVATVAVASYIARVTHRNPIVAQGRGSPP